MTSQEFRDRLLDSNDRFQAAMLEAIREHQKGMIAATDGFNKLDALQESVDELKILIMEQGEQIKALRERLNGGQR